MSIATEITRIQGAKADIKSAIEAKGVTVPSNALIDDYDTYIGQISGGGGGNADLINLIERDITSIDIPSGTTTIGQYAFQHCSSLISVTIPDTVTSIGNWAFDECIYMTSVSIPNSVLSIGNYAFEDCNSLTSISIPDSVATIGQYAFSTCDSLTSVTIPSGVTSIGNNAFYRCENLTSITVLATTPPTLGSGAFNLTNNCPIYVPYLQINDYKAASGWSIYSSRIMPIIAYTATYNVTDTSSPTDLMRSGMDNFVAEMYVDGVAQTKASSYTFSTTGTHTVAYATKKTSNPDALFRDTTTITSLVIGNGVVTVPPQCCQGCSNLTSVTLSDTVKKVESLAFYNSGLTTFNITDNLNNIGYYSIANTPYATNLINNASDGPVYFAKSLIYYKGTMPANTNVDIESGTVTISEEIFNGQTNLVSTNIPDTVQTISNRAFSGTSLTSVTIPSGVTYIGSYVWQNCSSLASVTVEATTPPTLLIGSFNNNASGRKIYVPSASVSTYKNTSEWGSYSNAIEAIPNS